MDTNNPATISGVVTTIEIYADTAMTDVEVATFFVESGDNLSTRDSETIGNVAAGYNSFTVSLDVMVGDFLGIYYSAGKIDMALGGSGYWSLFGDNIPCNDVDFGLQSSNGIMSLYGIGTSLEVYTHIPTDIIRADPTGVNANGLTEVDLADSITTRGFKYGLTEVDTWNESETGTYSEGAFSLTLTGLDPDTTYFIRAYAVWNWGTKYGSYLQFKTAFPYGSFESRITAEATASDADIALVGGERSLAIDNHLIQTQTIANLVAAAYLADYKDQKTKLVVTKPTPPPYSIGDTIKVQI